MNPKEFKKKFPSLTEHYSSVECGKCGRPSYHRTNIEEFCLDKAQVKKTIEKHFVHGYVGDGTVHSSNCRMCKVLKELGL